jgi:hypothetical protein
VGVDVVDLHAAQPYAGNAAGKAGSGQEVGAALSCRSILNRQPEGVQFWPVGLRQARQRVLRLAIMGNLQVEVIVLADVI